MVYRGRDGRNYCGHLDTGFEHHRGRAVVGENDRCAGCGTGGWKPRGRDTPINGSTFESRLKLTPKARWWTVVLFALAMAWVEAAVVFYLRTMIHRLEPYQANPLPIIGGFGLIEVVREAATLVMLLTVGILAGVTWRSRIGYAAVAFGVWDIAYYLFLKLICGWPHSLLDWDILFLIPLPWWGPVIAPMSIAMLMLAWGTLVSEWENATPTRSTEWKL